MGIYKSLPVITEKIQVLKIMENKIHDELMILPLSVGEYYPDWKFAQDLCIELAKNENSAIRANAVLGLAYIARTKGILEKHLVKPIILKELRENHEYKWRIEDSIEDINRFLDWNLAHKHWEEQER